MEASFVFQEPSGRSDSRGHPGRRCIDGMSGHHFGALEAQWRLSTKDQRLRVSHVSELFPFPGFIIFIFFVAFYPRLVKGRNT